MKEITTNGKTLLFVEVPKGAILFEIEDDGLLSFVYPHTDMADFIDLPQGNYQILGKSTELSEEQIVEWKRIGRKIEYRNYRNGKFNLGNPHDSYLSLLEVNEIVDRNPLGNVQPESWSKFKPWNEFESKIKHYLVLEKI